MAIKIRKDLGNGVVLQEAYARISDFSIEWPEKNQSITVLWYASPLMREAEKNGTLAAESSAVLIKQGIDITGIMQSTDNLQSSVYDAIKSLPEFAGAVDC